MAKAGNNFFKHTMYTGIVLGVVSIIYFLIVYLTDQMANQWAAWMLYPILFVISLVAVFYYRKKYSGGFLSFSSGFNVSYLPYLYGFVINAVYNFFFMRYLMTPEYINKIMDRMTSQMKIRGLSQRQIDASATATRFALERPMIGIALLFLSLAVIGAIFSVILAAVCRKDNENIAFEDI